MKLFRLAVLLPILALTACASNPMAVSESQTVEPPAPAESQIVFLRSSFVGSAINASLYDVTSGHPEFIGILANKTKIAHEMEPGEHVFMVVSEAADFLEAKTLPGRRYYSIVTPRMGVWKARFSIEPVRNDDPGAEHSTGTEEFEEWKANTTLVKNSEAAHNWYEANKQSVVTKYREYWQKWQQKPANEKAMRTLNPQDGL